MQDSAPSLLGEVLPLKKRLKLYFGAWLIPVVLLLPCVLFAPAFPAGLYFVTNPEGGEDGPAIILGWSIYFIHGLLTFCSARKTYFYTFFYLLIALLLVNVGGCYSTLAHLRGP